MTIRLRNRLTLSFFILAITCLFIAVFFTCFQFFSKTLVIPDFFSKGLSDSFLFKFRPWIVFTGIFLMMAYTCVTSLIILHAFEKTQATDITFFLLFLLACLCDTSRIIVPLLNLSGNYSQLLLKVGNVQLFARLFAPLALMANTILSSEEFRQHTDRICIILIIVAIFFAEFIPLNTAVILPNFCISYGYVKSIRIFTFSISLMSTFFLFLNNRKNEYKQIMTFGFLMIYLGYSLLSYSFNIANLVIGTVLLGLGTTFYLNEVHKHYLWLD